ncbi:MAG TPA: hypothetical protein VJV79_21775 [Polyangiaceae bacterium]|nr:hypothetical protein [Polyangiaceae bacterium]
MQRATKAALLGAALVLGGCDACSEPPPSHSKPNGIPPATSSRATAPDTIADPLAPDHPIVIDTQPRADAGNWVKARPGFQASRTRAQRDGIEPCAKQPVDTSGFEDWAAVSQGKFTAPRGLVLDDSGGFELVIHLLGDEPIRRELISSRQPFALYSMTVGQNQSYARLFTGTQLQSSIVAGVEQALSKRLGKPARVRHLAMSAWSAGFVGIEAALAQPSANQIDAVILIDGLHAPRGNEPAFKAQMKPFVDFAARAARGERSFFVSHSSIDPPDFASTSECAHYLIASLGGKPRAVRRAERFGLELVEYFSDGDFQVRGYAGNDRADHCAQLAVLRDAFSALGRRWKTHELSR